MTISNQKIIDDVLSLPNSMRADLIELLIGSLNLPTQSDLDKLWAKEAEKRIQDIESGKVKTISGSKVLNEIKEKYHL